MTNTEPLPQTRTRERVSELLYSCEPVRALWLAGSFARGDADRLSDLDFVVAAGGTATEVASVVEDLLSRSFEFVLCRDRGDDRHRLLNFVTEAWERFDLSIFSPPAIREARPAGLREVFDKDGLHLALDPQPAFKKGPSPQQVDFVLTEFLRVLGLLPVVLHRDDLVGGFSGAGLLRQHLMTLLAYERMEQPARGALNQTAQLTEAAAGAVVALPPLQAERGSIIEFHQACWAVFLEFGPHIAGQYGARWPARLVSAARSRIARELGVQLT